MGFSKYLAKNEKDNFAQFVALLASVENVLESLKNIKSTDKTYLKYLRTGRAWLEKAVNLRLANLDNDAAVDFMKHIQRIEPVVFCPSDRAKKEFKELEKMKSHLHIAMEDFQDMYCFVIEATCKTCVEENYKRCPLYPILMKHDIVAVSPEGIRCPYSYVDNEEALAELDKMKQWRLAQDNIEALDRAEKKLKELICEREELKMKIAQHKIDACKQDGALEKMQADIQKLRRTNRELLHEMKRYDERFAQKEKEVAEIAEHNLRMNDTVKFLREAQRRERARIEKAVKSAVEALRVVSKKGVEDEQGR